MRGSLVWYTGYTALYIYQAGKYVSRKKGGSARGHQWPVGVADRGFAQGSLFLIEQFLAVPPGPGDRSSQPPAGENIKAFVDLKDEFQGKMKEEAITE
jgi:hypothetical protein